MKVKFRFPSNLRRFSPSKVPTIQYLVMSLSLVSSTHSHTHVVGCPTRYSGWPVYSGNPIAVYHSYPATPIHPGCYSTNLCAPRPLDDSNVTSWVPVFWIPYPHPIIWCFRWCTPSSPCSTYTIHPTGTCNCVPVVAEVYSTHKYRQHYMRIYLSTLLTLQYACV